MNDRAETLTEGLLESLRDRDRTIDPYLGTVRAVARDVLTVEKASRRFTAARVMDRLARPDRVIGFRIDWRDDQGRVQVNQGWRVQPLQGGAALASGHRPADAEISGVRAEFQERADGHPDGRGQGGRGL